MADRFSMTGMPGNFEIPDDEDVNLEEQRARQQLKAMGVPEAEIEQAIQQMKNLSSGPMAQRLEQDKEKLIEEIQDQLGVDRSEAAKVLNDMTAAAKKMFGSPEGIMDSTFENEDDEPSGIRFVSPEEFAELTDQVDDEDFEDEDFDEEDDFDEEEWLNSDSGDQPEALDDETVDGIFDDLMSGRTPRMPTKGSKKFNINGSFQTVSTPDSFGVIPYTRNSMIYENVISLLGDEPIKIEELPESMDGHNLNPAFADLETLEYIDNNDKFVLFKGIPRDENNVPIYVAMIDFMGELQIIVPHYGNPYAQDGSIFNKDTDSHLFRADEKSGDLKLDKDADIEKIKAGLELLLYENKRPILSINQFGRVIQTPTQYNGPSSVIKIGKMRASDSEQAEAFKRDFDLTPEKNVFDFYIKLGYDYPARTLNKLSEYLFNLDFNSNDKLQTYELKADINEKIYIDLDLGAFPDNLPKWLME